MRWQDSRRLESLRYKAFVVQTSKSAPDIRVSSAPE